MKELKLLISDAGEAYHSAEAKDVMIDHKSLFAVDGITDRADCDASYDFDNAMKLNLIPVSWLSERNMHQCITSDILQQILSMHIVCMYGICYCNSIVTAALRSRCGHYIFVLWFLLSFFFFSSPNLSGHRVDVYHTSTHAVALGRI